RTAPTLGSLTFGNLAANSRPETTAVGPRLCVPTLRWVCLFELAGRIRRSWRRRQAGVERMRLRIATGKTRSRVSSRQMEISLTALTPVEIALQQYDSLQNQRPAGVPHDSCESKLPVFVGRPQLHLAG